MYIINYYYNISAPVHLSSIIHTATGIGRRRQSGAHASDASLEGRKFQIIDFQMFYCNTICKFVKN